MMRRSIPQLLPAFAAMMLVACPSSEAVVPDDPMPFEPDSEPGFFPEGITRQVVCPSEPDRFALILDEQVSFIVRTWYVDVASCWSHFLVCRQTDSDARDC